MIVHRDNSINRLISKISAQQCEGIIQSRFPRAHFLNSSTMMSIELWVREIRFKAIALHGESGGRDTQSGYATFYESCTVSQRPYMETFLQIRDATEASLILPNGSSKKIVTPYGCAALT